jgi:phosphatidylglycerophosphate synthase
MDRYETKSTDSKPTADCYSAGERGMMEWYQGFRQRRLGGLLRLMEKLGINGNHITFSSLICGLLFCPLVFFYPWLAFFLLFTHVIIDGLDGPLARHLGTDSRAGSFADTTCDQVVLAAATITLMCHPDQIIAILPGSIYLFLYTIVVGFAMVRNALGIPYRWLIRPRFVVYAWTALEMFSFGGTYLDGSVNIVIWVINGMFLITFVQGFFKIRANLL